MGTLRDDLLDTTMVRMPDGSYLPQSQIRDMSASQIADLYKSMGGFGSTLDSGTGIQSAQEMFNQTYAEAMANEYLANILEGQGVPDVVPFSTQDALRSVQVADGISQNEVDYVVGLLDQNLVTIDDVAAQTGIPAAEIQAVYNQVKGVQPEIADLTTSTVDNELTNGVDMLDPEVTGLGGDESIVTDDEKWDKVDKTEDIGSLLQDALDIFGLGNLNKGIVNVADVINDRNISVQDVSTASGNTVEYVNDAFEKAGVKINNQGETPVTNGDDSTTTTTTTGGGTWENTGGGTTETVGDRQVVDGLEVPKRDVVVDDRPKTILPALPIPEPQQAINFTLMQSIVNATPVTESILFPTKFTQLENVEQGMFEQFLRAAGGRR